MRKSSTRHLGLAFLIAAGCGPTASQSQGDASASDSTPPPPDAGMSSTGTGSTNDGSTGVQPACGNGQIEDGEWCYEPVAIEIELPGLNPDERVYRVTSGVGVDGETFVVWSSENRATIEMTEGPDGVELKLDVFHSRGAGDTPRTQIFPAKVSPDGPERADYIWYYDAPDSTVFRVDPGPSRGLFDKSTDGFFDFNIVGLSEDFDGSLVPIDTDDSGADEFLAFDPTTRFVGLYAHQDPSDDTQYFRGDLHVVLQQTWEQLDLCRPVAARAADIDGDGFEDGVLLTTDCSDGGGEIVVLAGRGDGSLSTDAAQRFPLEQSFTTLELTEIDGNDRADIVIAREGEMTILRSLSPDGFEAQTIAPPSGIVPPEYTDDTTLLIVQGQFDGYPGEELAFTSGSSLSVAFPETGGHHDLDAAMSALSQVRWYAASDINDDGLDDLAVLYHDRIVVHVSNP